VLYSAPVNPGISRGGAPCLVRPNLEVEWRGLKLSWTMRSESVA
jgi:hypothetical protein